MNDQDLNVVKGRLQGKANNYYARYLETMRSDKCLGFQYKLDNQLFNQDNLKAFENAYQLLGKHQVCIEALNLILESEKYQDR